LISLSLPSGSSWTATTSASEINTLLTITILFLFTFFNLILNALRMYNIGCGPLRCLQLGIISGGQSYSYKVTPLHN
jgi:hypothetical protein